MSNSAGWCWEYVTICVGKVDWKMVKASLKARVFATNFPCSFKKNWKEITEEFCTWYSGIIVIEMCGKWWVPVKVQCFSSAACCCLELQLELAIITIGTRTKEDKEDGSNNCELRLCVQYTSLQYTTKVRHEESLAVCPAMFHSSSTPLLKVR